MPNTGLEQKTNEEQQLEILRQIKDNALTTNERMQKQYDELIIMRSQFDEYCERLQNVEGKIRNAGVSVPGLEDEKEKFSFVRAYNAMIEKDFSQAGFEKEVFDAAKKALSTTTTAGGYVIPSELSKDFIEMLVSNSVLAKAGAKVLNGLTASPLYIPKQTSGATAYWVGVDSGAITASDQAFGRVELTPNKCVAMTKVSRTLVKLSDPSIEAFVRGDLSGALKRAIDLAGLRGTGSNNQPTGVKYLSDVGSVAIGDNGGDPTYNMLVDLQTEVEQDDVPEESLGWIFNSKARGKLNKLVDGNSRPLLNWDPTQGRTKTILGEPCYLTNQIPSNLTKGSGTSLTEIYYGNWSNLLIAFWGGIELATSEVSGDAFEYDEQWIRAIALTDVGSRHDESFALCADVATT